MGGFSTDANLTTLYNFAFFTDTDDTAEIIGAYNSTSDTWRNVSVGGGVVTSLSGGVSATTATSGLGLSFIGGGYNDPSASRVSAGMIRFDASTPNALSWRNETDGVPVLVGGALEYARFGTQGILVAVGYSEVFGKAYPNPMF